MKTERRIQYLSSVLLQYRCRLVFWCSQGKAAVEEGWNNSQDALEKGKKAAGDFADVLGMPVDLFVPPR